MKREQEAARARAEAERKRREEEAARRDEERRQLSRLQTRCAGGCWRGGDLLEVWRACVGFVGASVG